jgi:hypothetical protein
VEIEILRRGGSLYRELASSIPLLGTLASSSEVSGCWAAVCQLASKGQGDGEQRGNADHARFVFIVRDEEEG